MADFIVLTPTSARGGGSGLRLSVDQIESYSETSSHSRGLSMVRTKSGNSHVVDESIHQIDGLIAEAEAR